MTVNSFHMNFLKIFPKEKARRKASFHTDLFIVKTAGFADRLIQNLGILTDILYEL